MAGWDLVNKFILQRGGMSTGRVTDGATWSIIEK